MVMVEIEICVDSAIAEGVTVSGLSVLLIIGAGSGVFVMTRVARKVLVSEGDTAKVTLNEGIEVRVRVGAG